MYREHNKRNDGDIADGWRHGSPANFLNLNWIRLGFSILLLLIEINRVARRNMPRSHTRKWCATSHCYNNIVCSRPA